MHFLFAAIATAVLFVLTRRYTTYAEKEFSTQNTIDPRSVPGETPREDTGETQADVDRQTVIATNDVTLPMAQIASSFGTEFSPNPLNPVIPKAGYANTYLDLPYSIFNQPKQPTSN